MKYIEITANAGSSDTILAIADKVKARDTRLGMIGDDGMRQSRMLVPDDQFQAALDALQHILGAQPTSQIVVLPVETVLPRVEEDKKKKSSTTAARESLYEEVEKKRTPRCQLHRAGHPVYTRCIDRTYRKQRGRGNWSHGDCAAAWSQPGA